MNNKTAEIFFFPLQRSLHRVHFTMGRKGERIFFDRISAETGEVHCEVTLPRGGGGAGGGAEGVSPRKSGSASTQETKTKLLMLSPGNLVPGCFCNNLYLLA